MENQNIREHILFMGKVPKRSVYSFILFILSLSFTYIQAIGYLIPGFLEIKNLGIKSGTINDIGLMWVPILAYLLISLNICLFINIFKKIKKCREVGFVFVAISGLISGFLLGPIFGLITYLMEADFLIGLYNGIFAGFLVGLLGGLRGEFKNTTQKPVAS